MKHYQVRSSNCSSNIHLTFWKSDMWTKFVQSLYKRELLSHYRNSCVHLNFEDVYAAGIILNFYVKYRSYTSYVYLILISQRSLTFALLENREWHFAPRTILTLYLYRYHIDYRYNIMYQYHYVSYNYFYVWSVN